MTVDWVELLEKGGLSFVVIIGLAYAVLKLFQRVNDLTDRSLEREAKMTDVLNRTLEELRRNR